MDHSRSRAHIGYLLARRAETHGCCGDIRQSCDRGSVRSARRGLDNGADRRRRTGGETSAMVALGGDQELLDPDRLSVDVADRDLGFAVWSQVRRDLRLAHVHEVLGELVREQDRERHERLGFVRGVAEHRSLVAGTGEVEWVVAAGVGARFSCLVDALRDVERLLVDRVDHRARVIVKPVLGIGVADPLDRREGDLLDVAPCVGRISPEANTSPLLTSVSPAARPPESSLSTASRTQSEILSATLSGWPSVTDLE